MGVSCVIIIQYDQQLKNKKKNVAEFHNSVFLSSEVSETLRRSVVSQPNQTTQRRQCLLSVSVQTIFTHDRPTKRKRKKEKKEVTAKLDTAHEQICFKFK